MRSNGARRAGCVADRTGPKCGFLSFVALATISGSTETTVRLVGVAAIVYMSVHLAALTRRQRLYQIATYRNWAIVVILLLLASYLAAVVTIASGTIGSLEVLLITLLARPMTAFLFVLSMFGTPRRDG